MIRRDPAELEWYTGLYAGQDRTETANPSDPKTVIIKFMYSG